MRTDLDSFLTPGFGSFALPEHVVLVTGQGGYYSRNEAIRVDWIARKKLGLGYQNYENVGSTWYGYSHVMVAAANLSVAVMQWLSTQEFTEFESLSVSGNAAWPHWYKPVMSMYSGDIAINQIPHGMVLRSSPGTGIAFDLGTNNERRILNGDIQHMHVFQYVERFSKLKFKDGSYNNLDISPFVNMTTVSDYATVIAISSSRMNATSIRTYVGNQTAMSHHDWIRPLPTTK
jgi:hypothetical protein